MRNIENCFNFFVEFASKNKGNTRINSKNRGGDTPTDLKLSPIRQVSSEEECSSPLIDRQIYEKSSKSSSDASSLQEESKHGMTPRSAGDSDDSFDSHKAKGEVTPHRYSRGVSFESSVKFVEDNSPPILDSSPSRIRTNSLRKKASLPKRRASLSNSSASLQDAVESANKQVSFPLEDKLHPIKEIDNQDAEYDHLESGLSSSGDEADTKAISKCKDIDLNPQTSDEIPLNQTIRPVIILNDRNSLKDVSKGKTQ